MILPSDPRLYGLATLDRRDAVQPRLLFLGSGEHVGQRSCLLHPSVPDHPQRDDEYGNEDGDGSGSSSRDVQPVSPRARWSPVRYYSMSLVSERDVATATPPRAALPGGVVGFLQRRRWARRGLSFLSLALLVSAVGMLGYPVYTNLYQDRVQGRLERELALPQARAAFTQDTVATGDPVTRLRIPTIGVDVVVVEGTSASALRAGAGHYPQTPLPCEGGNVAIAGHRTTYGKPFNNLDRLKPGDVIRLDTPVGSCEYALERSFITSPQDLAVLDPTQG